MSSEYYREFSLGPFTGIKKVVSLLDVRFPGTYRLEKSERMDDREVWFLVEDSDEFTDYYLFFVRKKKAIAVGDDAYRAIQRVLLQVL